MLEALNSSSFFTEKQSLTVAVATLKLGQSRKQIGGFSALGARTLLPFLTFFTQIFDTMTHTALVISKGAAVVVRQPVWLISAKSIDLVPEVTLSIIKEHLARATGGVPMIFVIPLTCTVNCDIALYILNQTSIAPNSSSNIALGSIWAKIDAQKTLKRKCIYVIKHRDKVAKEMVKATKAHFRNCVRKAIHYTPHVIALAAGGFALHQAWYGLYCKERTLTSSIYSWYTSQPQLPSTPKEEVLPQLPSFLEDTSKNIEEMETEVGATSSPTPVSTVSPVPSVTNDAKEEDKSTPFVGQCAAHSLKVIDHVVGPSPLPSFTPCTPQPTPSVAPVLSPYGIEHPLTKATTNIAALWENAEIVDVAKAIANNVRGFVDDLVAEE